MKTKFTALAAFALLLIPFISNAQKTELREDRYLLDSLYIEETEDKTPAKVLHAEPLYIDLIRDLGARKGEKEWNVGFGLNDNTDYDRIEALVEYEWAPINRLGLEIEVPFSFYSGNPNGMEAVPANRMESLKLAAQYSFFVSEKAKTSLAIGYIHEFEMTPFENYGKESFFTANVYNPFFVAAKRWGQNFHTLIYTGPVIEQPFHENEIHTEWQINTNFHYMIPGTRNFLGVELNKEVDHGDFDMTIRPQMRLGITDDLMIGIVTGIPVSRERQRLSTFLRLIWEP
ncbi:HAEPLYID family protein [Persicobacter diffluens]|uniref:Phosphoribosylformylglycinamidine synthase n=1 Tax=Persicobacter diffluens TaxID=981 RepID=A0AAN4VTB2_9BACT|nr:hypothetical protein PEDI_01530 [Persicobacter diffluens]